MIPLQVLQVDEAQADEVQVDEVQVGEVQVDEVRDEVEDEHLVQVDDDDEVILVEMVEFKDQIQI
jgi:hypothetical protein